MKIIVSYFVVFALAMIIIMICLRIINTPINTTTTKTGGNGHDDPNPEKFKYHRDNGNLDKTARPTKIPVWEVNQIDTANKLVKTALIFTFHDEYHIGRMKGNDFVIDEVDDKDAYNSVSRNHLIIIKIKNDYYAEVCENDEGVIALTYLDGSDERITKRFPITDNLVVILGKNNSGSSGTDQLKPIRIKFKKK